MGWGSKRPAGPARNTVSMGSRSALSGLTRISRLAGRFKASSRASESSNCASRSSSQSGTLARTARGKVATSMCRMRCSHAAWSAPSPSARTSGFIVAARPRMASRRVAGPTPLSANCR
ncbi:Uncharacterised protein [Bordetella pertussis]|nr:Uncharacterised protein [Bordetella pertussis]CFP68404.1 Uncharacterised protein [Bordetella pertussis]CPJ12504.1 Uncharacterised protein [Bordetella pertussis]